MALPLLLRSASTGPIFRADSNGDVLTYQAATGKWIGTTPAAGGAAVDRMVQGAARNLNAGTPSQFLFLFPWDANDFSGDLDVTICGSLVFSNTSGAPETLTLELLVEIFIPPMLLAIDSIQVPVAARASVEMLVCVRHVRKIPALVGSATPPRITWNLTAPVADTNILFQAFELDFQRAPQGTQTAF